MEKRILLNNLFKEYGSCKKCPNVMHGCKVFGYGNINADICIIGEGPGRIEVEKGQPFVGNAGILLDKIFSAIDISRDILYVTNALVCRTTEKNRTPVPQEIENCKTRLYKELSIIKPKVTVLAGAPALQAIFGNSKRITKEHGQWITTLTEPCYFYFPIYHPAWIIHSVNEGEEKNRKRIMWEDIKKFRDSYKEICLLDNRKQPTAEGDAK